MSNGHKLEFIQSGDELHIYYWDWISGVNDTHFIIRNGQATKAMDVNDISIETPCNLALELQKLSAKVQTQVEMFYVKKDSE